LLIVLSSWSEASMHKRAMFRQTTLRLAPAGVPDISFMCRFVIGNVPGPQEHVIMGPKIQEEANKNRDIILVPAADTYQGLSHKLYKGLTWANAINFDYLLKTDEDMFLRLDVIVEELRAQHPLQWYWRGLAHWYTVFTTFSYHADRCRRLRR